MSNPRYHDDPDWYERPGETVNLTVDQHGLSMVVPALPWQSGSMSRIAELRRESRALTLAMETRACGVCARPTTNANGLCQYCARAQARDETHKARASQPQPSRPRLSIREGWEVWAGEQRRDDAPSHFETGHVREYETRVG